MNLGKISSYFQKIPAASRCWNWFYSGILLLLLTAYATIEYYNKDKKENIDFLAPIILAISSFFIVIPAKTVSTFIEGAGRTRELPGVPTDFLGAKGVFVGLIGIVTIEIYPFLFK